MPREADIAEELGITPLDVAALVLADELDDEAVERLLGFLYESEQEFLAEEWRGDDAVREEFAAEMAEERAFLAELGGVDPLHPQLPKDEGEPPVPSDFDIYFKFAYLRAMHVRRGRADKDEMGKLLAAYGFDGRDDAVAAHMAACVTHFHLQCLTGGVLPTPIGSIGLKQTMVLQLRQSSAPWFEGLMRRWQGHPVSDATGEMGGARFLDRIRSRS